ncbi:hypothetical protein [Alkalihalobacillus trypoxylicola]|uniref:General stress protein n=1 Tax=Alkalihalobacillus trypoxylicola TaxID=519424 RepID=A0A162CX88_9BACI|nr:hypothetical protein [Alkalihalobacillus trypoxylicola]KYG27004.1 hypothetical protein AZF04_11760 [Alkalihalobacillus trypoxylicola]GAF67125.1 hypothetical protein BTS2_4034 [Bacillus sp. TS-2]
MGDLDKQFCENNKCSKVKVGLFVGAAALITAVMLKKDWRDKVVYEANQLKNCTAETYSFIRDNREQIVEQVRITASEVSEVVKGISEDVKKIGESAAHLKSSSEDFIKVTKETAQDMKDLKLKKDE